MKGELTEYRLNIDIDGRNYSVAFKDFYHNHFVQSWGLSRGEVDISFFKIMTDDEKEIAKNLIRMNLDVRRTHIIEAAGEFKDEKALPLLYELYKTTKEFSWHMTIGRAIWKINADDIYPELLRQLKSHPSDIVRQAHFEQVTDLRNMESIEMLFDYLNDKDSFVQRLALSQLNALETGKFSFELLLDRKYFWDKRTDVEFKERLLKKLVHGN